MLYFTCSLLAAFSQLLAVVYSEQPNIVFVLADDLGYHDIGYHGSEINTPTLDQLANSGVILENYYVQPKCSPTRTQLLSGRYQIHTGLQHSVIGKCQAYGLPAELPTIADKLKEAGYSTHMVGKWHAGHYKQELCPWNRGFDSYFGFLGGNVDYFKHVEKKDGFRGMDLREGSEPAQGYSGQHLGNLFTKKAVDVIRNHTKSEKPLFLYLSYANVHFPLQVQRRYVKPYIESIRDQKRRIYAGLAANMDEGVKKVTDALKKSGLWSNTIFVFSSDNGGQVSQAGNNWPLRGQKASYFEGGMRTIGFVTGGVLPEDARGTVNHELIHVSDWFPTLVKLGSGDRDVIGNTTLDGFDQWKTISENTSSPREEILHNIDPLRELRGERSSEQWDNRITAAIRVGDYKLITGNPKDGSWYPVPPERPIPSPDTRDKNIWLFNIKDDPEERRDLSKEMPEVVTSMMERLAEYQASSVPVNYPDFDPRCNPQELGGFWGPWL